ncbi:MAG: serine--tRNA ligase [Deltaproteobacteria bacterium]|jgi:seryl-tRNA synthetase|nr:serine--tRNA ligase [Deltaproteobacteria bacterium]
MIDLKILQKDPQRVARALAARRCDMDMEEFSALDARRRALLTEVEQLKGRRNVASTEVAEAKRAGRDAKALIAELGALGGRIREVDIQTQEAVAAAEAWMLNLPNLPHDSVPVGASEADNQEVRRHGTQRGFDFPVKDHAELGQSLGGLDFERAAKLAGSRFCVSWDWAARLERALINFFLDVHTRENGYTEIAPPYMVNRATMTVTGNLPKFSADIFKLEDWDYFLIPTSEVPLTNLHAGEILDENELPLAYTAQTPCFRSEAGSYGKDTKGLIRMHQFMKVEMVRFAHPGDSYNQLELMRRHAEDLLERLELPYRTIVLCTGDMGFGAAKTYDLEVWLPAQNAYREISSCSNCEDFQARRGGIRFRPRGGGKPAFAHTLNGSGLAVGRALVAVLENGQQKDGGIVLPKALRPYMGGLEVITGRQ